MGSAQYHEKGPHDINIGKNKEETVKSLLNHQRNEPVLTP
jgi:hypothetical protein